MKKQALFYDKMNNNITQCKICPRMCKIFPDKLGNCGTRKNDGGILYTLIYGACSSIAIDPIEKKPMYNFYPGSGAFSISSVGCSFHCKHCQNYSISQTNPEESKRYLTQKTPEDIVKMAVSNDCSSIAYTYNEPLIWFEFILDTMKLARKEDIKNILVTNGYINLDPLNELLNAGLNAANVDIKAFTNEFYQKICGTPKNGLDHVLEATKYMHNRGVFIECTNLIIPGYNDNLDEIKNLAEWVKNSLSINVPLHFSAYRPMYKLNAPTTPYKTINNACNIAYEKVGLHYVYAGNVSSRKFENTYCPNCKNIIIKRRGYSISLSNLTEDNSCINCNTKINIVGKVKIGKGRFTYF